MKQFHDINGTYVSTSTGSLHTPWLSPFLQNTGHNLRDHWAGSKNHYFAVARVRFSVNRLSIVYRLGYSFNGRPRCKIAKFLPPDDVIHYLDSAIGRTLRQNSNDLFHRLSPLSGIPPCCTVYIYVHWSIVVPLTAFFKLRAIVFDPSYRFYNELWAILRGNAVSSTLTYFQRTVWCPFQPVLLINFFILSSCFWTAVELYPTS